MAESRITFGRVYKAICSLLSHRLFSSHKSQTQPSTPKKPQPSQPTPTSTSPNKKRATRKTAGHTLFLNGSFKQQPKLAPSPTQNSSPSPTQNSSLSSTQAQPKTAAQTQPKPLITPRDRAGSAASHESTAQQHDAGPDRHRCKSHPQSGRP